MSSLNGLMLRKNIKDCCRTCLNDVTNKMHGLFDKRDDSPSLVEILSLFTNILVQTEDMTLPRNLCSSCFNCLINFYNFKKLAEKVDLHLHQYYDNFISTETTYHDCKEVVKNEFIDSNDEPLSRTLTARTSTDDIDFQNESDSKEIKNEDLVENIEDCSFNNILELSYSGYNLQRTNLKKSKHPQNNITYQCSHCPKIFKVKQKYENHLLIHKEQNSDTESVKCDVCSATFKTTYALAAHKRIHVPKGRILSCQYCNKVFKKLSHLKRHEGSHDVNRKYKCSLCPKAYHLESSLLEHMHKHNGIKPHPCPICPKAFAHLSTLNNHLKLHTRGKAYLCPTCGKGFDSNTNLTQHVRRHLGLKQFACTLCPGKFVSKGELLSHVKGHTGEKSYKCKQCTAAFTAPYSLKKHTLKHLGLKPHQCDTCPMKFTTKEYLRTHYRIHTGEKPYRCDLCERAFTQSGDLLKHKRVHLGVNLYKCDQCSQSFRLKCQLRDHISDHYVSAMKAQQSNGNTIAEDKIS